MQTQALDFKDSLRATGFMDYPVLVLEESFEPSTTEHVQRQKETGKFLKRLNKATPAFDEVWEQQLNVEKAMADFKYVTNTVMNDHGLTVLVGLYAKLDVELQKLQKVVKQHAKQQPELEEYYENFKSKVNFEANVFDMMVTDMSEVLPLAVERHNEVVSRHEGQDLTLMEPMTLELDDLKVVYKESVKKAKKSKK